MLFLIAFIVFSINVTAQISVHLGANGTTAYGLRSSPYDDAFVDINLSGGLELGYRVSQKLEFRVIGYYGGSSKNNFGGSTPSNSKVLQLGLKPVYALLSSKNQRYNFDLGFPVAYGHQTVRWEGYLDESRLRFRTTGTDKAGYIQFGISPTYRFFCSKTNFTWSLGMVINHLSLLKADRMISEQEEIPSESKVNQPSFHPWNAGVVLSLGYLFR